MPQDLVLAAEFPAADEARWRALAEKSLKGAPWERLVGKSADGAPILPLYRETDIATAADAAGLPGAAPFTRGAAAARDPNRPWHIRQAVYDSEPAAASAVLLEELAKGASSIELAVDPNGGRGVKIGSRADLSRVLDGVIVEIAPISLDAPHDSLAAARLLMEALRGAPNANPHFNVDPIGAQMRSGVAAKDLDAAAAFARDAAPVFAAAKSIRVDARPVHEAGGSEGQELGAALAAGAAYLRALTQSGLTIDEAARAIAFTVSVGPDVLIEAAKLRALRLCWSRMLEACGANESSRAAFIHAVSSRRMMTRYDAWTNILRGTAACFAAAIGGADAITVLPLTDAIGKPTAFGRRIARNTQLILMEESHLGHVTDPAGGAWFVEAMTQQIADGGWAFLQRIETAGGIVEALNAGLVQSAVNDTRDARLRAFAMRRETITGVSDFPLLDAAAVDAAAPWPADAPSGGLAPIRWAAPLEAIRDRGEAAGRPKIFFATLGPLSEFSARTNFSRNLFAAGGVDAFAPEAVYDTHADRAAAFAQSGLRVAVIAGSDARYGEVAEDAARSLKAAGCDWIVLAGRPGDREIALRAAGVDQFVFAGQDALSALETLHKALGIG